MNTELFKILIVFHRAIMNECVPVRLCAELQSALCYGTDGAGSAQVGTAAQMAGLESQGPPDNSLPPAVTEQPNDTMSNQIRPNKITSQNPTVFCNNLNHHCLGTHRFQVNNRAVGHDCVVSLH